MKTKELILSTLDNRLYFSVNNREINVVAKIFADNGFIMDTSLMLKFGAFCTQTDGRIIYASKEFFDNIMRFECLDALTFLVTSDIISSTEIQKIKFLDYSVDSSSYFVFEDEKALKFVFEKLHELGFTWSNSESLDNEYLFKTTAKHGAFCINENGRIEYATREYYEFYGLNSVDCIQVLNIINSFSK